MGVSICDKPSKPSKPKGMFYRSDTIRGRGARAFSAVDCPREARLVAMKLESWRDEQHAEGRKLAENPTRNKDFLRISFVIPNTVGFFTSLKEITKKIAGEHACDLRIVQRPVVRPNEVRVLEVSAVLPPGRPVKFFWSVHDFLRSLEWALMGHWILSIMGILHHNIREDSIVLSKYPPRCGCLLDYDVAVENPEKKEKPVEVARRKIKDDFYVLVPASSPAKQDESTLSTGAMAYMSFNVLAGGMHTYHDDLESFLYVLFFFFLRYAGPLPKQASRESSQVGFVVLNETRSGRMEHMKHLPAKFKSWAKGDMRSVAESKEAMFKADGARSLVESAEVKQRLEENWPDEDLRRAILVLLERCWQIFIDSRGEDPMVWRTKVDHLQFTDVLSKWLAEFADLEDKHSQCPFEKS